MSTDSSALLWAEHFHELRKGRNEEHNRAVSNTRPWPSARCWPLSERGEATGIQMRGGRGQSQQACCLLAGTSAGTLISRRMVLAANCNEFVPRLLRRL